MWSFQAEDRLRVATLEGLASIDPNQANVPKDWTDLPAYRLDAASVLHVAERSRGLTSQDANELQLRRTAWLSFDGGNYTIVDEIGGKLNQGWRLGMTAPYALQSARVGQESLLITAGESAGLTGVELRAPQLTLTAVSHLARVTGSLPATGWRERFTRVSGELVLAPGFRLLAAIGPDSAPEAWLDRWHLIDIFAVLLIATVTWRVLGVRTAAVASAAIVLTYQEPNAPVWLWLNLLIAIALLRVLPPGRLHRVVAGYRLVALVVLVLALAPFVVTQARLAVYPQLEASEPVLADSFANDAVQRQQAQGGLAATLDAKVVAPEAPPPPPVADEPAPAAQGTPSVRTRVSAVAGSRSVEEIVVTGARKEARYEPGAVTQAGPGIPTWRYHVYSYSWNGPVEASETARFIISPPWLTRAWRVLGLALSILLLLHLTARVVPRLPSWWPRRWLPGAVSILLACSLGLCLAPPARAATTPESTVLSELRSKLLAPPKCAPDCVGVLAAEVVVAPSRLSMVLTVSALDTVGLALPAGDPDWSADGVQLDGSAAGAVYRDARGVRYVSVPRGRHVVRMEGPVPTVDTFALSFPIEPHVVDVSAAGWDVGGVANRHLVSGALELVRHHVVHDASASSLRRADFPSFVSIARLIHLAHEWTVETTVTRVAPKAGAFTVRIPLLPQEAVTTSGLDVSQGVVTVGLTASEGSSAYSSSLPMTDTIELTAATDSSRTEHWVFDVSPAWHADFVGFPAVLPEDQENGWVFEYYPRPGEHLKVSIHRPPAVKGSTVAFDHVWLQNTVGKRSTDSSLRLAYRSTQGGRQLLRLPEDAVVTNTASDGAVVAVRPERGELLLPMLPGSHNWTVSWQRPIGTELLTRSPPVSLSTPASNLELLVRVPDDRWVLFAFGPGVGPTILYWGELLVFVITAWGLGRSGWTPLSARDWLLLGLGLSTFSWLVLGLFALFVAAFHWRSLKPPPVERRRFNSLQVGFGLLAIVAIGALVTAVPQGLLAHPDMRIAGAGGPNRFAWFVDESIDNLPTPGVLSVSLWWYKIAMLGWALWLSFALTRWIKWAWQIYSKHGLWRSTSAETRAAPPPTAANEVE